MFLILIAIILLVLIFLGSFGNDLFGLIVFLVIFLVPVAIIFRNKLPNILPDFITNSLFEIDESVSFSDLKGKEFNSFMRGAFAELYGGDESAINFRTLRVSELKDKKPYQDVIWGICKENTGELSTCVALEDSNIQSTIDVTHKDCNWKYADFSCSYKYNLGLVLLLPNPVAILNNSILSLSTYGTVSPS